MRFDPNQNASGPEREIVLRPRSSLAAALLLVAMALLALLSLSLTGLMSGPLKGLFAASTLLLVILALIRLGRHRPRQILLRDDDLTIETATAGSLSISACQGVFLSPWYLAFVGLDDRGRRLVRVALFRDQLGREAYRRLSAWLRKGP